MKRLAREVFKSDDTLSEMRAQFLAFLSPKWRQKAPRFLPTPASATLSDFQHALDPEPNHCSTEAVALLLFAFQRQHPNCRVSDLEGHRAALFEYWDDANEYVIIVVLQMTTY